MIKIFEYDIIQMTEFLPGVFTPELNSWVKLRKSLRRALVDKIGHGRFRVRFKALAPDFSNFLYGDRFEIVFFQVGDAAIFKLTHM